MFSTLLLGGSLGPEAALLALCGAAVSGVASGVFCFRGKRLRECALMGMTAGLAAFFGVALGGSLFALEVLHPTLPRPIPPLTYPALHYPPTLEAPVNSWTTHYLCLQLSRHVLLRGRACAHGTDPCTPCCPRSVLSSAWRGRWCLRFVEAASCAVQSPKPP